MILNNDGLGKKPISCCSIVCEWYCKWWWWCCILVVVVVGGGLLDIIDVTCLDLFLWTGDVRLQIVTYKRLSH